MAYPKTPDDAPRTCRKCGKVKPASEFGQRVRKTKKGVRNNGLLKICKVCDRGKVSKVFTDGDMTLFFQYAKSPNSDGKAIKYTFDIFRHILRHGYIKLGEIPQYTGGHARSESVLHFMTPVYAIHDGKKYVLYEDDDESQKRGIGFVLYYKLARVGDVLDMDFSTPHENINTLSIYS